jgi:hypothetical protein
MERAALVNRNDRARNAPQIVEDICARKERETEGVQSAGTDLFTARDAQCLKLSHQISRRGPGERGHQNSSWVRLFLQKTHYSTLHCEGLPCPWAGHYPERAVLSCRNIQSRTFKTLLPGHGLVLDD